MRQALTRSPACVAVMWLEESGPGESHSVVTPGRGSAVKITQRVDGKTITTRCLELC